MNFRYIIYTISLGLVMVFGGCDLFQTVNNPAELNQNFQIYGSGDNEEGIFMSATPDGGYILGGHSYFRGLPQDFFIVKVDAVGQSEWAKIFGDFEETDILKQIMPNGDGGYYLLGDTIINTLFGATEIPIIMELDDRGVRTKSMLLDNDEVELAIQMEILSDGKIAVLSNYDTDNIIRLTVVDFENSTVEWSRSYTYENFGVSGTAFRALPNGGFIITGTVYGNVEQMFMLETDDLGGEVNVRFIGNGLQVRDFEVMDDGSYMVLANECGPCFDDLQLFSVSSDFNTTNQIFVVDSITGSSIQMINDELIITGLKLTNETVGSIDVEKRETYIRKTDLTGNTIWEEIVSTSSSVNINRERTTVGNAVAGQNGNFFLIGTHDFATNTKMALFQFNSNGKLE